MKTNKITAFSIIILSFFFTTISLAASPSPLVITSYYNGKPPASVLKVAGSSAAVIGTPLAYKTPTSLYLKDICKDASVTVGPPDWTSYCQYSYKPEYDYGGFCKDYGYWRVESTKAAKCDLWGQYKEVGSFGTL